MWITITIVITLGVCFCVSEICDYLTEKAKREGK